MATLDTPKLPPTSPPAVPHPPTPNVFALNSPDALSVAPVERKTQEEIDAEVAAELEAQKADMEAAKVEEEASDAAMAALEGAFVPNGIFRHRGVGPIKYETKRGLVAVFPGDLVCKVVGPTNPDAPEAEWILEYDYIICSQAILSALLFSVPWKMFPDTLEVRAVRIGEERRAAPPPPELLSQKAGESNEAFAQRKKAAEEEREKKAQLAKRRQSEKR